MNIKDILPRKKWLTFALSTSPKKLEGIGLCVARRPSCGYTWVMRIFI